MVAPCTWRLVRERAWWCSGRSTVSVWVSAFAARSRQTLLTERTRPSINDWLCKVFHPDNRDNAVAALLGTQDGRPDSRRAAADKRLKDAEAKLRRHQAAIDAGVDPAALVEPINHAQAERQAAKEELQHLPEAQTVDVAEIDAMLDQLGDVARHLNSRSPDRIMQVYRDLGLQVVYDNKKEAAVVTASPRVVNVCVRGGT